MSNAYKGLTIEIGANTVKLQQALKSVNSAADEAQKHLRRLEKAANLDPSNLQAVRLQFGELRDQASAVSTRVRMLDQALAKLDAEGIGKIANQTQDAAYKAEKAREAYAGICAEIKRYKNALATAHVEGFDVNKGSTDPFKGLEADAAKVVAKMREIGATEQEIAHYADNLVPKFHELAAANKKAADVREYKELKARIAEAGAEAASLARRFVELKAAHPAQTLTEEFKRAEAELRDLDAAAERTRQRMAMLDDALRIDPQSVEAITLKLRTMVSDLEAAKKRASALSDELDMLKASGADKVAASVKDLDLKLEAAKSEAVRLRQRLDELKSADGFDKSSMEAQELIAKIKQAETAVQRFSNAARYMDVSAAVSKANAEIKGLEAGVSGATDRFRKLAAVMQNMGWSMTATVSAAMSMFARYAVSSAEEVDAAYRNMRKTVQGTEEQFESLRKAAIDYSRTHVTSADEILQIEALGGQLGVATSNLREFATVVSNLSIATDLDADTAAQQLGQLSGILNDMSQNDFAKYGDALTRLGNNNATLESKISDVMLRISSMGTITGFTTPQLLAWSTAIAATGQGAESAGTAISKTMSNIEGAVGAGGDKLQAFADVAGVSAAEFADAWKKDPSTAMKMFVEGLKGIEESGGSADATLTKLKITSVRQKQAILGLMQTIDGLNANLQMSQDAWDGVGDEWGDAGDAAREAERKAEGFSGAIQLLRNNFQAFGVEVGSSLEPAMKVIADAVAGLTKAFADSSPVFKGAVNVLIGLLAAVGPALVMTAALGNGWRYVTEAFGNSKAFNAAAAGINLVTQAAKGSKKAAIEAALASEGFAKALTSAKFVLIATLIARIAQQLVSYVDGMESGRKATEGMSSALEGIKSGAGSMSATYEDSAEKVISAANKARDAQAELSDSISDSFSEYQGNKTLLDDYVSTIKELAGQCDGSAESQRKLKIAVDGYNQITGDTVKVTDMATGTLSKETTEIVKNSDAWEENAKKQALQQAYADVLKQQQTNKAALVATDAKLAKQEKGLGLYVGDFAVVANKAGVETHDLENAKKQLEEQDESNAEMLGYLREQLDEYDQSAQASVSTTEGAANAASDYAAKLGLTSDEFAKLTSDVTDLVDGNSGMADLFAATGLSIDGFAYALEACGVKASDLATAIDNMKSKVQNAFDRIKEEGAVTAEQMIANLENNINVTAEWSSNLQQLYARAGEGAGRSLVDSIAAKGPEYASTVAALLGSDDAVWAELVAKWEQAGHTSVESAAAGMNASAPVLRDAANGAKQQITDGMTTTPQDGIDGMSGLIEGVDYSLDSAASRASGSGSELGSNWAGGVSSGQGEAASAGNGLAIATSDQIQNAKDTAWHIGAATGSNFAVGVWSKMGEAHNAGSDVSWQAIEGFSAYGDYAWQWGAHMGSNFASGIWSKQGEVAAAAQALANAAAAYIEHSVADKGPLHNGGKGEAPWGAHMVQNYVKGVRSQIPALNAAMREVAAQAQEQLQRGGGDFTLAAGGRVRMNAPVVNVTVQQEQGDRYAKTIATAVAGAASNNDATKAASMVIGALPGIIAKNTPVMGENEFSRQVRKAVKYA